MPDRPFLIVRETPAPGRPHPYDVILEWVAENFPGHLPLFRLASLPHPLGDAAVSLHVPWLRDPVEGWSMEVFEQAARLAAECDARGIPVINRVDRLINATKLRGAELMANTGVRVPKMAAIASVEEFRDTLYRIPLPIIVREDWGHQGELLRADTLEEARSLPLDRFVRPIVVELIDVRDPKDGYFRKYRYFAIGDRGISSHLQISRQWITRGEARVEGDNARFEELDYIGRADPNHAALQRAREALGLDYVAFDYSYDPEGRVVVWEGNPYPFLHFSTRTLVYRNASMHRTLAGLLKLYLDRAGLPSPERLDALLDYRTAPSSTWAGRKPMPVVMREKVAARGMRCVGEFALAKADGDRILLNAGTAPESSILVLARSGSGGATVVPHARVPGEAGFVLSATSGPLLLTLLVDDGVAEPVTGAVSVTRQTKAGTTNRQDAAIGRKTSLYLARALVVEGGQPVDQLRIRATLEDMTRFCLAGVPLDGSTWEDLPFSPGLQAPYRYIDIAGGASLISNPFVTGGAYVAFLIPWQKGRTTPHSAISEFEAFSIPPTAGEPLPEPATPAKVADAAAPDAEAAVLAALDEAREAHVLRLVDLGRKTGSDDIRAKVVDRLVAMNRCPDSLISARGVSARAASSFRRAMTTRSRMSELQEANYGLDKDLGWHVGDKEGGYRLAGLLGANLLHRDGPHGTEETLRRAATSTRPVVVKPVEGAGSWGVHVVQNAGMILDLRQRQWLAGLDDLAGAMSKSGRDRWLLEDFAAKPGDPLCPAAELKFYAFYGRVGLVLEAERYPMPRSASRHRDGSRAFTGRHADQMFDGEGFSAAELAAVEWISGQIPLPFLRIDLLRGEGGLHFGAFTARPDDLESFDADTDAFLGDLYLDGELRLARDLLLGTTFPAFMKWAAPLVSGDGDASGTRLGHDGIA